ncbi:MAG: hypothetical protein IPN20_14995 [Haliscomenobacter sp.]|nr:hypothetical protein [Haliscomenobacter sp.]
MLLGRAPGIGEYYSLKSRLVKFLHAECGFEVLAIESGIGDVYLEYRKADTISAVALRKQHCVWQLPVRGDQPAV